MCLSDAKAGRWTAAMDRGFYHFTRTEMYFSSAEEALFDESPFISKKPAFYMTENLLYAYRANFLDYIQPVFVGRFSAN